MLSSSTFSSHWFKTKSHSAVGLTLIVVTVQPLTLVTPWTAAHQATLFFTVSWSLLKLMSIELVMPSNHHILCRPLLLLLSVFPSIRVFSNESVLHIRCQSIRASTLASVLPMNIQGWFPLGLTGLISLLLKGLSRVFSSTTLKSMNSSAFSLPYGPTLTSMYDYWESHSSDSSVGKESSFNAGEPGSIPGSGRSPGEEKGYPLQYSGLENSMNSIFYGVTKSRTQLSDFHFSLTWLYGLLSAK